jgi:hypothetical protein
MRPYRFRKAASDRQFNYLNTMYHAENGLSTSCTGMIEKSEKIRERADS